MRSTTPQSTGLDALVRILDAGDLCSLLTAVVLLLAVGRKCATEEQRSGGQGLALLAFLLYAASGWWRFRPATAQTLLNLTVRSLLASGLALGLSWLALPASSFLYRVCFGWIAEARKAREDRLRSEARAREEAELRREEAQLNRMRIDAQVAERAVTVRYAQEQAAKRRLRLEQARAELQAFVQEHGDLLQNAISRSLVRAYAEIHMNDDSDPGQAWQACHDLLHQLQPVLGKERQRREKTAQRQTRHAQREYLQLDADIAAVQKAIAILEKSNQEAAQAELAELRAQLAHLQTEKTDVFTPDRL